MLEIASGSGEHAAWLAPRLGVARWQPSDADAQAISRQKAQLAHAGDERLSAPLRLDVTEAGWEKTARAVMPVINAVLAINMIHISPWDATLGLFRNAGRVLHAGGVLLTYGPYLCGDIETAASNLAFDADLKRRNPEWGIRHLDALRDAAMDVGLTFDTRHTCPANNFVCVFRKSG